MFTRVRRRLGNQRRYRTVLALAVVLTCLLSAAGRAHNPAGLASQGTSAEVRLEVTEGENAAKLLYRPFGGDADRVAVDLEVTDGTPAAYIIRAGVGTAPGPGCSRTADPAVLRCAIPSGAVPTGPDIRVGGGDDTVRISPSLYAGAVVAGGLGSDRLSGGQHLIGGPGNDTLRAATGNRSHLDGGPGADQITGWLGRDLIVAGPGRDTVDAGGGDDRIVAWFDGRDHVICGDGLDIVRADGVDLLDPDYWDGDRASPTDVCDRIVRSTRARAVAGNMLDPSVFAVTCPRDLPPGCVVDAKVSVPNGFVVFATKRWRIRAGRTAVTEWYHHREPRFLKTTLITYPPHGKPRKAVAFFHFAYGQEG